MWILTGGDDNVHLGRLVLDQEGNGSSTCLIQLGDSYRDKNEIVWDGGLLQGCQNDSMGGG
jgi:hypothetical protein